MTSDAKHTLGAVLMWGGVALAALATAALLAAPDYANVCLAGLIAGPLLAFGGAFVKKRHCPSCRAGACSLPAPSGTQRK